MSNTTDLSSIKNSMLLCDLFIYLNYYMKRTRVLVGVDKTRKLLTPTFGGIINQLDMNSSSRQSNLVSQP